MCVRKVSSSLIPGSSLQVLHTQGLWGALGTEELYDRALTFSVTVAVLFLAYKDNFKGQILIPLEPLGILPLTSRGAGLGSQSPTLQGAR